MWYNFCILLGRIEQIQSVMKTLLRNFLSVLRRFRMAAGLNVVGLSLGFRRHLPRHLPDRFRPELAHGE